MFLTKCETTPEIATAELMPREIALEVIQTFYPSANAGKTKFYASCAPDEIRDISSISHIWLQRFKDGGVIVLLGSQWSYWGRCAFLNPRLEHFNDPNSSAHMSAADTVILMNALSSLGASFEVQEVQYEFFINASSPPQLF